MRVYNTAFENYHRLKNVLISDKQFNPEQLKKVLKSDLTKLFNNFAEFSDEDLTISIGINDDGSYNITTNLKTNRLKIFAHLES